MADSKLLHIPEDRLRRCFAREPFAIAHELAGHPLFQLDALVDLARRNSRHVQWHSGDLDFDEVRGDVDDPDREQHNTFGTRQFPGNGLDIRETIEKIETCGTWMLIREIGELPEYKALLDVYMGEVRALVDEISPGMHKARSDVVISSPGVVTPFHMDEEQNFLLEIRGWKDITIADGLDARAVTEADKEVFFADDGELHPGRTDAVPPHTQRRLEPGQGIHIPSLFPHCVKNGDGVSIAVTTMFLTEATDRRRDLYRLKRWQRKLGLPAAPVGAHPRVDAAKLAALDTARRVIDPLRGRGKHSGRKTEEEVA